METNKPNDQLEPTQPTVDPNAAPQSPEDMDELQTRVYNYPEKTWTLIQRIAGGALGSLLSAVLRIFGYDFFLEAWSETPAATYLGVAAYLALCALLYGKAVSAKATTN